MAPIAVKRNIECDLDDTLDFKDNSGHWTSSNSRSSNSGSGGSGGSSESAEADSGPGKTKTPASGYRSPTTQHHQP